MLNQLLYFFITCTVTFALYPIWINFVYKFQMREKIRTEGPETHLKKQGTPTMGGFVFIFTVSVITLLFNRSRTQTLLPVLIASMAGLFGILEDFSKVYKTSDLREILRLRRRTSKVLDPAYKVTRNIPVISAVWKGFKELSRIVGSSSGRGIQTYQKFLIQWIIAGFVSYWTYFKLGWDYIWFPLIGNVHIGWLYPIFIFILFLTVLNFVAFTDGLDGLAGGLAIITFAAYWVLASQLGYNSLALLAATFVGALLPFLYFNVHPARIFMGDVGSHVLGASLGLFAVVMHREVALLAILAVFLADGISSPLQQLSVKLTKKRLFRMAPLHHHFEMLGWPETKVTLRFWIFGAWFALLGIFIALL